MVVTAHPSRQDALGSVADDPAMAEHVGNLAHRAREIRSLAEQIVANIHMDSR